MFFYKVEGHMPKLSSFGRGKTIRPKKSLTSLLHAALQLSVLHPSTTEPYKKHLTSRVRLISRVLNWHFVVLVVVLV